MESEVVPCLPTELDHHQLLSNLRKFIEKWFLLRRDSPDDSPEVQEIYYQMKNLISLILTDGLLLKKESQHKLLNELHWLHSCTLHQEPSSSNAEFFDNKIETYSIYEWISASLKDCSLCSKLQLLVSDKELLHNYYSREAFLRNETFTTALFISISSVELNQSSLLSQIDSLAVQKQIFTKHRRSSSHPQFSISPKKYSLCVSKSDIVTRKEKQEDKNDFFNKEFNFTDKTESNLRMKCLEKTSYKNKITSKTFFKMNSFLKREWYSLPDLRENNMRKRPRSKTISQPISIPCDSRIGIQNDNWRLKDHVPGFAYNTNQSESVSSNYNGTAASSKTPKFNDLIPIQLVKCDDIKIYFDQSYNSTEKNYESSLTENSISYDSPPESKGLSPINFLSCMSANLFSQSDENLEKTIGFHGPTLSTSISNDFVNSFLPQQGEKLRGRAATSMFDDFPDETYDIIDYQPLTSSQSLAAFLQTAQFSRNNTDLERENAHFKISEAIIAIIEHMKWAKIERELMQAYSSRHKHKTKKRTSDESQIRASVSSLTDKDDTEEDDSDHTDDENNENAELCQEPSVPDNDDKVDDHVAYAEWGETNLDALSAEGVALSLISKFSDNQLPKATDLTWLVSEEDTPQELLPMPESPAANPDDHYIQPFTRGTRDWAPPRQQIIFTDHPPPNRKMQLQKQKYRCAGCGMKVALMYAHRFRYCTYLGKYLCTGCHRNQISTLPAKILEKWDFSYYPVSVFAYRLLEQMWTYPLFYIPDLNPSLYDKIKNLHTGKVRRIQLKYIQDFIKLCRFADKEQKMFESIPTHLTGDPDKWAMSDFIAVKCGHLQKYILELIKKAEEHVLDCMLCTARGFICELCSKTEIIYPWQSNVKRCDNCGSCYHQKCWRNKPDCMKCQRLRVRQQKLMPSIS